MIIAGHLIPGWLSTVCGVSLVLTCLVALRFANWGALKDMPSRQHLLFGGAVACLLLWLLSLRVTEDLWMHFLGVTALTLILGWCFALLSATVAVLVHIVIVGEEWAAAPLAWLLTVMVPISTSRALVHLLRKRGLRNLFVFMLGAGFAGGMLSVLSVAATALVIFYLIDQQFWLEAALNNWPMLALLMFPEGFINGMLISAITVYFPQLVKTFDEDFYLEDK